MEDVLLQQSEEMRNVITKVSSLYKEEEKEEENEEEVQYEEVWKTAGRRCRQNFAFHWNTENFLVEPSYEIPWLKHDDILSEN
jgi:hypothetical protein